MMTKAVLSMALVAAMVPLGLAAPAKKPAAGAQKQSLAAQYGPAVAMKYKNTTTKAAKGMCGLPAEPCLFYGGDFIINPLWSSSLPNGLANEDTLFVAGSPYGAATWVPFTVPTGKTWVVGGLFSNNQSTYGVLDQAPLQPTSAAYWAIAEGVTAGGAGTVIASGTSAATSTPTGRSAFGDNEYTIEVKGVGVTLTSGEYWMAVVPLCTNTADPYCSGVFFLSDVEYIDGPPANAVGSEPLDQGYFDSSYFGVTFEPTAGPLGACGGFGCDSFSAGVLGKAY